MSKTLQRILFNLKAASLRHETLGGRAYIVAPVVMLTEGVHAGSSGPILYNEELFEDPAVWNHVPIVVYHPQEQGVHVSACSPEQLDSRGVGMILNAHRDTFNDGQRDLVRLCAEAWMEEERLNSVDNRILEALRANQMVEVSTGLYPEIDPTAGVWNDSPYGGAVTSFQPDHLAILPDKEGACSIADGAGLLRNEEATDDCTPVGVAVANLKRRLAKMKTKLIDKMIANGGGVWAEEDREFLATKTEEQLKKLVGNDEVEEESKETAIVAPVIAPVIAPVAPVIEEVAAPVTANQYIANAPPEIRDMLANGLQAFGVQRASLVDGILANGKNVFTKEALQSMDMATLKGMAQLANAVPDTHSYAGMAAAFGAKGAPLTGNQQESHTEEALPSPDFGFAKA